LSPGFLFQLAGSTVAVGALVALAAWAKIARPAGPLDEVRARTLLAEEFPGRILDGLWVATDGAGALAKSGGLPGLDASNTVVIQRGNPEFSQAAGATVTDRPHDRPWGIYSGYFKDPDGHLWEVIWNPKT